MARAISYFIFSSNGSYLRWDDDTTIDFLIRQYEMSITGGGGVDRLYVGAGTKVDAGALFASANTDELYLSGNFSDYDQTISAGGVYTFTGLASGSHANEVVSFSMNSNGDKLVFANGHVTVKSSDYLPVSGSYSSISAGSLTLVAQTDPTSGAEPGNKPAKVFVFDAGGINIPQLPIVDEAIAVSGGGGIDKFYVRKGTHADAIGLFASAGQDVLYLTGRFGDYTQTKSAGGVYTFTRNFTDAADASLTEVVSFSMNSSGDQLVFANGGVTLRLADYLTDNTYADITVGQLNSSLASPGFLAPNPGLQLASDTGIYPNDGLTSNVTINVWGLGNASTWTYQVDGGSWQTGTGSSLTALEGVHTYNVQRVDSGATSDAISAVVYTLDTVIPAPLSLSLASDTGRNSSDGVTNNATILVIGLETGQSWQYQVDAGNWIMGFGSSLIATHGAHGYAVRQIDWAGNTSATSTAVTYTLDNTAPVAPTLRLAVDSGSSASDGLTNNATLLVNGLETTTGTSWQYQVDGTADSWITGTASVFTASSGKHTYAVQQIDLAGNHSIVGSQVFTLDQLAPTILVASTFNFDENRTDAVATLTANPNVSDASESTTVTWGIMAGHDGAWFSIDPTSGALSFQAPPDYERPRGAAFNVSTNNDTYTVNVSATDAAGNISTKILTINVMDVNEAPFIVTTHTNQTAFLNQPYSFNVASAFGDPDTISASFGPSSLRYFATGLPSGFSISATGIITGTATSETSSLVTVSCSDGGGLSVSEMFTFNTVTATIINGVFQGSGPLIQGLANTAGSNGAPNGALTVQATDSAGHVLNTARVQDDGSYSLNLGRSIGVIKLQLLDNNGAQADFYDTTILQKSAGSGAFSAIVALDNVGIHTANINALTSVAAKIIANSTDARVVRNTNDAVAQYFVGLAAGNDVTALSPQYLFSVDASGNRTGTAYAATDRSGQVLALLSAAEQLPNALLASTTTALATALASASTSNIAAFTNSLQSLYAQAGARLNGLGQSQTGMSATHVDSVVAQVFPSGKLLIYANQDVIAKVSGVLSTGMLRFKVIVNDPSFAFAIAANDIQLTNGSFLGGGTETFSADGQYLLLRGFTPSVVTTPNTATATLNSSKIGIQSTSNTFTFTLGTPTPYLALDQDTGISATDRLTANQQLKVYNLMGGSKTWQYQQDGGNWVAGTGNALNLANGVHTYSVRQINGTEPTVAETTVASTAVVYTLDAMAPSAPNVTLASDTGTFASDGISNYPVILVAGVEAGASWAYQIDSTATQGWTTGSGLSFTALSGLHTYFVRQTDTAGNTGSASISLYTLDTNLPSTPTLRLASDTGFSASDNFTSNPTINVVGLEPAFGTTWQYRLDDGNWLSGSGSSFIASGGKHTYVVRQTDTAGNIGPLSTAATYTLSEVVTGISLNAIANGSSGFVINEQSSTTSFAGDVNGDGYADILLIKTQSNNRAYVILGKTDYSAVNLDDVVNGSNGFIINGQIGDGLGRTVRSVGDANGDSLADFIIGAPYANNQAGRNYVVFGKTDHSAIDLGVVANGTGGFVINGPDMVSESNFRNGYALSSAGDINGDGLLDFVIAWPIDTPTPIFYNFRSYVVFGKRDTLAINLADLGSGGFVINYSSNIVNTGNRPQSTVTGVGDVNGDGLADLLVGLEGDGRHEYYLLFGKNNALAVDLSAIANGNGGFIINARQDQTSIKPQSSISAAGDVNGDGLADFIVGTSSNNIASRSYVVFGKTNTSALNLNDVDNGSGGFVIVSDTLVASDLTLVSIAGDLNGDGLSDLIIATPNEGNNQGAYLVFGKNNGSTVYLSDVVNGSGGFIIKTTENITKVSAAGDINGDGFADVLLDTDNGNYVILGGLNTFNPANVLVQGKGTVRGSSSSEALVGSSGNDILIGNGGTDRFFGGAGDDITVLTASDITNLVSKTVNDGLLSTVDGGTGINTLRLSGGANLDLTTISNITAGYPIINSRIANIDYIDLATDTGINILTLAVADVLDMAGMNTFNITSDNWLNVAGSALTQRVAKHQLAIHGSSTDSVILRGAWVQSTSAGLADTVSNSDGGVTHSYHVYNSNNAQLLIDINITPMLAG